MAFAIDYNDLAKKSTLHGTNEKSEIYIENTTLIKAIEEDINPMIDYLISIPSHDNVIKPLEKGKITYSSKNAYTPLYKSAYRMQFLPNAKSLSFLYQSHLSYEEKLKYIKQLFSALQFLHHYLVIGDIHANNLIVSNGKAYIIDLDGARKKGSPKIIWCAYHVKSFECFTTSIYTDITKLYLESLAFILKIGFQNYIKNYGYQYFWDILTSCHFPKEVMEFLLLCKYPHRLKVLGQEAYHFENFINPNILENEKELKRTLHCL